MSERELLPSLVPSSLCPAKRSGALARKPSASCLILLSFVPWLRPDFLGGQFRFNLLKRAAQPLYLLGDALALGNELPATPAGELLPVLVVVGQVGCGELAPEILADLGLIPRAGTFSPPGEMT